MANSEFDQGFKAGLEAASGHLLALAADFEQMATRQIKSAMTPIEKEDMRRYSAQAVVLNAQAAAVLELTSPNPRPTPRYRRPF